MAKWTDEEFNELYKYYEDGLKMSHIVKLLNGDHGNNRTEAACWGKLCTEAKKERAKLSD